MRTAGRAALAACALALGGCSYFSWFKSADEKPMPLAEIRATVTPRVAWSASVGRAGEFKFFPRLEAGRVFTAAADGTVTVLDPRLGRTHWGRMLLRGLPPFRIVIGDRPLDAPGLAEAA